MIPLTADKDAEIIEAFNSTSRYLDDWLTIGNAYFYGMVGKIYPSELQLNKANSSSSFWIYILLFQMGLSTKCDDFDFDIVNFPFVSYVPNQCFFCNDYL